jgi:nucleoside-diphosphate-sugar epimerase
MSNTLLVTGSSGLIGSEVVDYFCRLGWQVHGLDNNMRADFLVIGVRYFRKTERTFADVI